LHSCSPIFQRLRQRHGAIALFLQNKKPDHRLTRLFGDIGAVAGTGKILLNKCSLRYSSGGFKGLHQMFRLLVDSVHFYKAGRVLLNIKSNLPDHFSNERAVHRNVCKCRKFMQMKKIQPDSKLQRASIQRMQVAGCIVRMDFAGLKSFDM
jgi:hypothetical protein